MKRVIPILLALLLCFSAGCKKKQAAAATLPAAAAAAAPTVPGSSQTAGNVTVFVPEGWVLGADETKPEEVRVYKGSETSGVYVKIVLYPESAAALPAQGTCENVSELPATTYSTYSWSGFSGTKVTGIGQCSVTYLVTNNEGHNYLATLWSNAGAEALSLTDTQVQAILAGVGSPLAIGQETTPPAPETPEPPNGEMDVPPTESNEGPSPEQPIVSENQPANDGDPNTIKPDTPDS